MTPQSPHPRPVASASSGLSRRNLLFGGLSSAAVVTLGACGASSDGDPGDPDPGGATGSPWEFTDGRGETASLPAVPTRIVAQAGAAGALWDLGIRPVGVFGGQSGSDILLGNVDPDSVEWVGTTWGDFNVEAFAALKPDLLVAPIQTENSLWYVPPEVVDRVEDLSAVVGIRYVERPVDQVIDRYAELAASLGADLSAESVLAAKADFQMAGAAVTEAVGDQPDLRVLFVTATQENLYVSNPVMFSDLYHLRDLGVPFVIPTVPEDAPHYHVLAWEQADHYPADVVLYDARNAPFFTTDVDSYPTFANLPAVRAGQIYPWNLETATSWAALAPALTELADQLSTVRTDVAG